MVDGKARDRAIVPCDPHRTDRRCDHRFVLRIHGRRYAASARCAQAERRRMKINIEVDCTPEEARRVLGRPDLTPLQDKYVATMGDLRSEERRVGKGWYSTCRSRGAPEN